jgi:hypothetical protein
LGKKLKESESYAYGQVWGDYSFIEGIHPVVLPVLGSEVFLSYFQQAQPSAQNFLDVLKMSGSGDSYRNTLDLK